MQTKHRIQQLLASAGVEPNKRLGQNFLIDLNLMRLLIETAHISEDDIVLEVGCGTGSLTEALTECAGMVIAVEIDKKLAEIAAGQIKPGNIEVINADILETKSTISRAVISAIQSARRDKQGRFLLVSNLPYNIASPLMMDLITSRITADAMYVTVQKEVAERMTAEPGDRHYGTLSIHMAATGEVKTERLLKPTVFWPQPQVHSAMVSFVRRQEKVNRIQNMEIFGEVISLFMQHRRKMVQACTKFAAGRLAEVNNWPEIFQQCGVDPHNRPEQLAPEDYIAVANLCSEEKR